MFLVVMRVVDVDPDMRAGGNAVAAVFERLERAARHRGHGRHEPQRFLERHLGQVELAQIVIFEIARAAAGIAAPGDRGDFVAQPVLPFGMLGEQPQQRGGAGGDGVVRGHHQEVHVIDHFVDRHQAAIVIFGGGELAEHVLPAALGAAAMRFAREIVDQIGTAIDAALHLRERQRLAHRRHAGLDHVDKGGVDPVRLGAPRNADEAVGRQVERQFLDRRIEEQLRPRAIAAPFLDPPGDAAVERVRIMPHRAGLEGDRQRAAIGAVMIEIEQHQPAREQLVENRSPALFGAEDLVAVHQQHLVGLGTDQRHVPATEGPVLVHTAVFFDHAPRLAMRVGQHLEGVADDRPPPLARDVRERIFAGIAFLPMRRRGLGRLVRGKRGH